MKSTVTVVPLKTVNQSDELHKPRERQRDLQTLGDRRSNRVDGREDHNNARNL